MAKENSLGKNSILSQIEVQDASRWGYDNWLGAFVRAQTEPEVLGLLHAIKDFGMPVHEALKRDQFLLHTADTYYGHSLAVRKKALAMWLKPLQSKHIHGGAPFDIGPTQRRRRFSSLLWFTRTEVSRHWSTSRSFVNKDLFECLSKSQAADLNRRFEVRLVEVFFDRFSERHVRRAIVRRLHASNQLQILMTKLTERLKPAVIHDRYGITSDTESILQSFDQSVLRELRDLAKLDTAVRHVKNNEALLIGSEAERLRVIVEAMLPIYHTHTRRVKARRARAQAEAELAILE